MSSKPTSKPAEYVICYWPGIPGRGEFIRLVFEHVGVPYTEHQDPSTLIPTISNTSSDPTFKHPPSLYPPALKLPSGRLISQTPAIIDYLANKFGLTGASDGASEEEKEELRTVVNQLVLTALDLASEAHDVHHPIAVELYYHEQKDAALLRAQSFRKSRLIRFLQYFQSVLASNPDTGNDGTYLIGNKTTAADLVLFHVITGVEYAFPKRIAVLKASGDYANVFKLRERVEKEKGIKEYIDSGRRLGFNERDVFRHYEELDGEE